MPRKEPLPADVPHTAFSVRAGAEWGLSRDRMRGADLCRPFPGARIRTSTSTSYRGLCAAYLARCPEGQFFSHVTAARLWRMPLPLACESDRVLDVAVIKPKALPRVAGVRGHRLEGTGLEIVTRYGLLSADAVSAWCQLGTVLDHDDLVAAGDYLVRRPRRPEADDRRPYARVEHLRERSFGYRGAGARRLRQAVVDIREGADSRRESILRLLLQRAGLPEPELNSEIVDARGCSLGWADLLYRERRVIVEYDGDQHRTDYEQFEKDALRLENFRHAGYTVVQVRRKGLAEHRERTIARVADALGT